VQFANDDLAIRRVDRKPVRPEALKSSDVALQGSNSLQIIE
jgi:hypothetical protein